jgi:hypothetical protein
LLNQDIGGKMVQGCYPGVETYLLEKLDDVFRYRLDLKDWDGGIIVL